MAHKHSIYDTDLHFIIDPITRKITSESGKVILMQNDHNSERFTFQIPRYVEGHDMSLCNATEVHYINTDSSNKRNVSKGVYPVTDLQLSPDDPDKTVILSWLVSQNSTLYPGTLHFLIRFACVENSVIEYQWFTDVYIVISIAKGIYNTDVVTEDYNVDLLEAWKTEVLENTMPYVIDTVANANDTLAAINAKVSDTEFFVNFETGNLEYASPNYEFTINTETGNLEYKTAETGSDVIQKVIEQYSEGKADSISRIVEGTSVVVDDSAFDPIRGLRLFGKTEQFETTGAQLFDPTDRIEKSWGSSWTVDDDGWFSATLTNAGESETYANFFTNPSDLIEPSTKYLVVLEVESNEAGLMIFPVSTNASDNSQFTTSVDDSGSLVQTVTTRSDFSTCTSFMRGFVRLPAGTSEAYIKFRISLIKDTSVTLDTFVWEPYTGGIPSPNPAYPQEIDSIGGDSGSIVASVKGKNLYDISKARTVGTSTITIENGVLRIAPRDNIYGFRVDNSVLGLQVGKTYTCSIGEINAHAERGWGFRVVYIDSTYFNRDVTSKSTLTFTPTKEVSGVQFYVGMPYTGNQEIVVSKIQVEEGSEATEFEEYKNPRTVIALTPNGLPGLPVSSGGNYTDENGQQWICDEVDFGRGVYVQRLVEKTFDAGSDETWRTYTTDGEHSAFEESKLCSDMLQYTGSSTETGNALSDKYCMVSMGDIYSTTKQGIAFSTANPRLRVSVRDCDGFTLDEFKAWIAKNPFKLLYQLATPIETELSYDELQSFKSLYANYPVTTVMNDSGAHMEVEYNVDTKTYINAEHVKMEKKFESRIAELEALLVAAGVLTESGGS